MTDQPRPLEGRILAPGEPPPPSAPPPDVVHVHVYLPSGEPDPRPVEADTPWWRPAYPLRTALAATIGLTPLPHIGAPAARWALVLGDAAAEQSMGAAWTIAAAAVAGAFAADRGRRRWDPDKYAWRPAWLARAVLCAAISGACLTLPVFDTAVSLLTGVNP